MAANNTVERGKLHGLTWAPSKRFVVVVAYEIAEIDCRSAWAESWPVAAFSASGDPIILDGSLLSVDELMVRYKTDKNYEKPSWSLGLAEDHPLGCRRIG